MSFSTAKAMTRNYFSQPRHRLILSTVSAVVAGLLLTGSVALAGGNNFVVLRSNRSFSSTIHALKESVNSNHMMVMASMNQGRVLSMTGLRLRGESFLVGSPVMGKKAFGMDPAVGVELPARIYVWVQRGNTYIGYIRPSFVLAQVSSGFKMMGNMLDKKLHMIAESAAR